MGAKDKGFDIRVLRNHPPIVVLGSGGSGTRVVAAILMKCGCYIGRNLNSALDNLDFAFAFPGRIMWVKKSFPFDALDQRKSVTDALALFLKLNFNEPLTLRDRFFYLRILGGYFRGDNFRLFRTRPLRERVGNFLTHYRNRPSSPSSGMTNYVKWGFKLPGAILCLNSLIDSFPGIKIIHMVRDGRDMAFSKNQRPVLFFADLFGLDRKDSAQNSFAYWSRLNSWAYDLCAKRLAGSQYHIVRFEDICLQPKREIDRLLAFADLEGLDTVELYDIPQKISSMGRWKEHPGDLKDVEGSSALQLFGYV